MLKTFHNLLSSRKLPPALKRLTDLFRMTKRNLLGPRHKELDDESFFENKIVR